MSALWRKCEDDVLQSMWHIKVFHIIIIYMHVYKHCQAQKETYTALLAQVEKHQEKFVWKKDS
jgi:hypothetical protein